MRIERSKRPGELKSVVTISWSVFCLFPSTKCVTRIKANISPSTPASPPPHSPHPLKYIKHLRESCPFLVLKFHTECVTESTGSPSSHREPPCFGQRVKCGDLSENERVAFLTQKFDIVLNKNKPHLSLCCLFRWILWVSFVLLYGRITSFYSLSCLSKQQANWLQSSLKNSKKEGVLTLFLIKTESNFWVENTTISSDANP